MTSDERDELSGHEEISWEVLDQDHIYTALCHARRRYLCYILSQKTELSLTEMATKIAALEHGVSEPEVPENQREQVYVSLYHTHVPKLDDADVLAFDQDRETVTTARHTDQILSVLNAIAGGLDN